MARVAALVVAALALCAAPASAVIGSNVCYQYWEVKWIVATVGPIFMCGGKPGKPGNSTVVFKWNGSEDHGVFQIPNDACPEGGFGGFATDTFKELAASAPVGEYVWQLPETPGDYWVTSQAGSDCANGMKAQVRVMTADTPPVSSSGTRGATLRPLAAVAAAAAAVLAAVLGGL